MLLCDCFRMYPTVRPSNVKEELLCLILLKTPEISKWFIGIQRCCILIYLGFRHISSIASAISWLIDLASLLIGAILNCSMYP